MNNSSHLLKTGIDKAFKKIQQPLRPQFGNELQSTNDIWRPKNNRAYVAP